MWFKKKREPKEIPVETVDGFHAGDVVQHKVTGAKAVIVRMHLENGERWATVSIGWQGIDEFDTTIAEIKPFAHALATNAVDPHAQPRESPHRASEDSARSSTGGSRPHPEGGV